MQQDSHGTYHDYEFKINLPRKLNSSDITKLEEAIKKSPLFFRTYECNQNTWYELRFPDNKDVHNEPYASILIGSDYIYITRDSESVWDDIEDVKRYIIGFST